MKILKVIEPGKFEFEERSIPVPAKDEVLLKMKYCGICGSDIKVFTGQHPYAAYPRIMGHEICAELDGEPVSVNPYFTCGKCSACNSGKRNCCLKNQTMGVQRDGAYAEYIVVPSSQIIYNRVNLTPKFLAILEPFAVALHAIKKVDIHALDKVMIFGAGPIGAFCTYILSNLQVNPNIADPHDKKLHIAMMLGALYCINTKIDDMNKLSQFLTYEGDYDVCIDASGSKEAIWNCFNFVKTGGKVILIGHSKEEFSMPHSDIIKKELTIFASRNSVEFYEAQIEMMRGWRNLNNAITDIVPFMEVPEFYKRLVAKDDKIVKALIEF